MKGPALSGPPPAGGSGCHIWFDGQPPEPMVAVSATLEVLRAPSSARLYFWALQATFAGEQAQYGAAHTGLQWNPRHPGSTAINWGGYHHPTSALRQFDGTASSLPGIASDPNTRNFPWHERRPYRFTIRRGEQGWAAEVTDLTDGTSTVIRELFADGDRLIGAVVWAELFCHCDDPQAVVRWSDFAVVTAAGRTVPITSARVNIPAAGSGACDNLDVAADGRGGFVITTATTRRAADTELHRWA